ncbi:hypothetical protein [Candidatus Absconditicoccus praedator]|uniref:hypothetical protein n=1 Tax=Candidatus Absconditicoccus praedator TaxID=2735562 RepID=UPI001E34C93E|nr:hypothetical protein [Candidatus Absconditicoccus praedator]UFX83332.1 hypothetical protein HLG78_04355 [Candidatus Absconditicoccus praedator]
MFEILTIATILTNFGFVYLVLRTKGGKDKIFYTLYMGATFLVFIFLVSIMDLVFMMWFFYFMNLTLAYLLYTDFVLFNTIKEFLLSKMEMKAEESKITEVFNVGMSNKLKEINNLEKDVIKLTSSEINIIDFVMIIVGIFAVIYSVSIFYLG